MSDPRIPPDPDLHEDPARTTAWALAGASRLIRVWNRFQREHVVPTEWTHEVNGFLAFGLEKLADELSDSADRPPLELGDEDRR